MNKVLSLVYKQYIWTQFQPLLHFCCSLLHCFFFLSFCFFVFPLFLFCFFLCFFLSFFLSVFCISFFLSFSFFFLFSFFPPFLLRLYYLKLRIDPEAEETRKECKVWPAEPVSKTPADGLFLEQTDLLISLMKSLGCNQWLLFIWNEENVSIRAGLWQRILLEELIAANS